MNKRTISLRFFIVLIVFPLFFKTNLITPMKSQETINFGVYYSDILTPGTILTWKFNRFNISGFDHKVLQDFLIEEENVIELKILQSLKTYNELK